MQKTVLAFFFALILCNIANAQYKYTYYLDRNFASVNADDAAFIGKGMKEGTVFRLDCFNKFTNELFLTAHFADSTLSSFEGNYESFFTKHRKESTGNFSNGLEEGVWLTWDSTGLLKDSVFYENGRDRVHTAYIYDPKGIKASYEHTDSTADTYTYKYYGNSAVSMLAEFKGNTGTVTYYDSIGAIKSTETVTSRKMEEAQFPGSPGAFKRYLERNMNGGIATDNKAPVGSYTVVIRFIVGKDGALSDIYAETNAGYGMEQEGIRVISRSPNWIPATQFGYPIRAYRRQPFSFVVAKE